jgi:hypothetical protein
MTPDGSDWEGRLPVDDFGDEIHWSLVERGFGSSGYTGYRSSMFYIATDNAEGH